MKIHDLIQGSPEWLAYRAQHFNASDAPAMMGVSPYKTRAELLRELHTGVAPEADAGQQKRFDNGHRAEALARPLAEEFIGEDLYPVTGSEGRLSASFDGLTMDERQGFEHKALNAELRAAFDDMETIAPEYRERSACRSLPKHHRIQMEQQLLVSGAERILFMASEWTASGELVEERHCWYYPDAKLRQAIVDGWSQLERELAAYVLPEAAAPAPVGRAPETLPALRIEVTGSVTASNLAEFKATALAAIRSVNRSLSTDQDFADADKAVKWCSDVETRVKAAKEHALSQTATIDALFKALDDISAEARTVRLDLDKLVARRKTEVKEEAVAKARADLREHLAALNAELAPFRVPEPVADFAGAIKGLRSFDSMADKLGQVLTVAKIAAEADARGIRANVATYREQAAGFKFLFADLGALVHKAADDFAAVLQARIATHKAAETQRIAAAEQRAREQEAARIAEQQRQAVAEAQAASAARIAAEVAAKAAATTTAPAPAPMPAATVQAAQAPAPATTTPRQDDPATLKLGVICERLGFTVSAAFLADVLHVKPAKTDGRAVLFRESQFALICQQLQAHVSAMAELYAAEVVS